ncbi:hypothetical protein G4B88_028295 [Cannabis sativa]|uniref:DUF4283 domain-containing protein n=1 Tax=Cannabis sativa TaxID=3483 RepID=A0A7J6EC19_CANSA|nr:hypothetical protein G4B88_028295 [Cannabis sativa]
MEVVNASSSTSPLKGKCLSVNDELVKLVPCESSRKALSTFCLLGKVVAPMSVSEANVVEFVAKAWKFPVTVVALAEGPKYTNCFELSFAREEDRSWALDHGPWCIRGYTFFLQVWSSTSESPVLSDMMRLWVQVHNIPHEYFSMENGYLLGGKAGKVIYVDLQENNPASWTPTPLFPVENTMGMPFLPRSVVLPKRLFSAMAMVVSGDRFPMLPVHPVWVSKSKPAGGVPPVAISGREGAVGFEENEKETEPFPGIEPPISEATKDRSSMLEPNLNMCRKEGFISLVNRHHVGPISEGGPIVCNDPIGVKCLNQENLNIVTVGDNRGDVGSVAIGPCVSESGQAVHHVDKGKSPMLLDINMGNVVSGPSLINNATLSCGPALVESQVFSNPNRGLMGPAMLGINANGIGPNFSSQNNVGHVEASSHLPNVSHGAVEHSNEEKALTQFFNAQESLLHDLKHFGNLDLYEIRKIGGDIRVPASSEVNERTTPFKKRKFEASASLCSRPHKVPRKIALAPRAAPKY